jgi:hypothetical protein
LRDLHGFLERLVLGGLSIDYDLLYFNQLVRLHGLPVEVDVSTNFKRLTMHILTGHCYANQYNGSYEHDTLACKVHCEEFPNRVDFISSYANELLMANWTMEQIEYFSDRFGATKREKNCM